MEKNSAETLQLIRENIRQVIVGKAAAVDLLLICLLCEGHALIEDVPGLGKTSLVAALAASVDCSFQRIQFTPDVLPSDVTGFTMYHPATGEKQFFPGAVMSQIILADEINRTSPKTQSSLLQAMQEGQVTVDGETHVLPRPFMVCATQNPVELTGTYPLPEAQLDRFLMRIAMGYPEPMDEIAILERNGAANSLRLNPVASADDLLTLQRAREKIQCRRPILQYIVSIANRTREHRDVSLGVSPRGSIALMKAAMGAAMLAGRDHVLPDDVQSLTQPVLAHRLVLTPQAYVQSQTPAAILEEVLRTVPVPAM